MRALVTGSQLFPWPEVVKFQLNELATTSVNQTGEPFILVQGGARGVDRFARTWAREHALFGYMVFEEEYPAKWSECDPSCPPGHRRRRRDGTDYCPIAGHRRNQRMVDLGADTCLAFRYQQSGGTTDCMNRAAKAGIHVALIDVWVSQYVGKPLHREG